MSETVRLPIKVNAAIVIRDFQVVGVEYEVFDWEYQPWPTVEGGDDDIVAMMDDGHLEFDADIVSNIRSIVATDVGMNLSLVPWEVREDA